MCEHHRDTVKAINPVKMLGDITIYTDNKIYVRDAALYVCTIKCFSDCIGMGYELDKYAKATFKTVGITQMHSRVLDSVTKIRESEQDGTYEDVRDRKEDEIQHP